MKTLTRPMFNMGGPIKQGIMHGIREPHKHGGPTGTGLVGDQRYPKTGGREHHVAVLGAVPWIARAIPAAYRGFKAARTFAPGTLGKWGRVKDIFGFGPARYRATTPTLTKGEKFFGKGKKQKAALRKLMKEDPQIGGPFQRVTMTEGKPLGILLSLIHI